MALPKEIMRKERGSGVTDNTLDGVGNGLWVMGDLSGWIRDRESDN